MHQFFQRIWYLSFHLLIRGVGHRTGSCLGTLSAANSQGRFSPQVVGEFAHTVILSPAPELPARRDHVGGLPLRKVPFALTRRSFLKESISLGSTIAALKVGNGRAVVLPPASTEAWGSRVVIARDEKIRSAGAGFDSAPLARLLDRALQASFDCDSPLEAWKKVVRPGEVVGLKVNCLGGRGNATHPELVEAIIERLRQAGITEIVIWDRQNADLERARFKIAERAPGVRCFGNDVLGFEDDLATFGEAGSRLCRTLTQVCDAVINLPVLKDHGIAGVTLALKSMFGAIHNPNKYHTNVGDPYVADVYALAPIRRKVRLHICDGLNAQYDGGPSYMPQWMWPFSGLLVSCDPVALDYVGWKIIETKRLEVGAPSLREQKREPVYISTAADNKHRLGTCDPQRIERMEI